MCSKIKFVILFSLVCLFAVGCNTENKLPSTSWGRSKVYNDFLWKKHVPDTLTKTICFDFNEDSRNHMREPLVLGIFKKNASGRYVQVMENEMLLFVDKQQIAGNTITVPPTTEKLTVGVVFTKKAEEKVHYWYIKVLEDGGLDRINDTEPSQFNDANTALMEVTAEKKKVWNPLAEGMTFGFSGIIIALLVWIFILKPIFFPTFKIGNISIQNDQFSNVVKARGFHKVILTSSKEKAKQGFFEKTFVGKTKFVVDPRWTCDVAFEPRDKSSIRIRQGKDFMVDSRILKKAQEYTLENIQTGSKSKIVIS